MRRLRPYSYALPFALALALPGLTGCDQDPASPTLPPGPEQPQPEPEPGQSTFISADGMPGQTAGRAGDDSLAEAAGEPAADGGGNARSVEEGDIYRVLDGNLLLNLNSYRGVQVVDFADPANPAVIGRLPLSGQPVELYVVGDQAIVLLNHWVGYWGSRDDLRFGRHEGGLVALVDLSDPAEPRLVQQRRVPGWIRTSRLAREGERASIYVAAQVWAEWGDGPDEPLNEERTIVRSFELTTGRLAGRSLVDLGGYVADIQATPEALLVARNDWDHRNRQQPGSLVSIIDISNPDGRMVEGKEVQVSGIVRKKTDMDVRGGVLRVVSGGSWRGSETNHLETFSVSDLFPAEGPEPEAIDHETFGDGQDLYATLFMEDRAFFVTYRRVDPFHAFAITPEGDATERSEFVVSGWNDWFRPVARNDRLIGIGFNDEGGRQTLAVSLYDVTDLDSAEPLIDRAEVDMEWSWSEAAWDDRAFTVLENAVDVQSPDGAQETGLVLLPFSGWSEGRKYQAGVQIYTFSRNTLTRRGVMAHGSPVRRTFMAADEVTANLSEVSIQFHDATRPDAPEAIGEVELAPDYQDVVRFGDYAVRLKSSASYWWFNGHEAPDAVAEVIPANAHPDTARPVATIELPPYSRIKKMGDHLVAIQTRYVDHVEAEDGRHKPVFETLIETHDLSDPRQPVARGRLATREIEPTQFWGYGHHGGWGWGGIAEDCFDCGYGYGYYGGQENIFVLDQGLAFVSHLLEQESLGQVQICQRHVAERCEEGGDCYHGHVTCEQSGNEPALCHGQFNHCERDDNGYHCEPMDEAEVARRARIEEHCWDHERVRYWQRAKVHVVDLRQADTPRLMQPIETPVADEAQGVVQDTSGASILYLSAKRPFDVPGDPRPFARFFLKKLDLQNLDAPQLSRGINVPGAALAVDGNSAWTRDFVWGEAVVETALARVELRGDRAVLRARRRLRDQQVHTVLLDGAGHALVSHRTAWQVAENDEQQRLTILDADEMTIASESTIDRWANLSGATAGRALFQVSGGLLVVNTVRAERPFAQAYFPLRGWASQFIVEGENVVVPAGRFGVYRFALDAFNLLPEAL